MQEKRHPSTEVAGTSTDAASVPTSPTGKVRQPKFEPTSNTGASETPSDYIGKRALPFLSLRQLCF